MDAAAMLHAGRSSSTSGSSISPTARSFSRSVSQRDERPSAADRESEAKRRKLRKGTRSCWECKRRKVRCSFQGSGLSSTDAVCVGCQRRGASCVSQEFPEETEVTTDRGRHMGERLVRIEALVEQIVKSGRIPATSGAAGTANPNPGIPTPGPTDSEPSQRLSTPYEPSPEGFTLERENLDSFHATPTLCSPHDHLPARVAPADVANYERISEALHAALPCQKDVEILRTSGAQAAVYLHRMMYKPYPVLEHEGLNGPDDVFNMPGPKTHPVLLAKHMLMLATFLQYLHPEFHIGIGELSETPRAIMRRLVDTAISLVTTNDELLGTIEGLECVLLESMFQANSGNLRRAWMACRRAMAVAQLMGIHRSCSDQPLKVIDPNTRVYPQFLWYRIVYADRFLCLMLGLPQGSLDKSMAAPAALESDTPMGRLERIHCALAMRILDRNESDPSSHDFAITQEIDAELQKAANELPSKWWLPPNLSKVSDDNQKMFWETLRLVDQLFHYHLLNQLHLPYMLRSSSAPAANGEGEDQSSGFKYEYSRMTCINASREVLNRFITFRSFNRIAYFCRSADFFALMAAMTLLLAHLDGHRRGPRSHNILAHQRPNDRAMVEQVLESMECVGRLNMDVLSEKSADLLRRLLAIEADAAEGRQNYNAAPADNTGRENDGHTLRMYIPYFGIIKITREGAIYKESLKQGQSPSSLPQQQQQQPLGVHAHDTSESVIPGDVTVGLRAAGLGAAALPPIQATTGQDGLPLPGTQAAPQQRYHKSPTQIQEAPPSQLAPQMQHVHHASPQQQPFAPHYPSYIRDSLQQYQYPGLTASANDWAFQGVENAYFDNLLRVTGPEDVPGAGVDWTTWQGEP
ncbi:hypothetical protein QBC46DRAFT_447767 [Diplogelasinospora grovesii]|uniref:Zn(2)-C6 fungal-type domain-containing protein n=1 Tax=Diplogelasinospora grovesii TaxID=303347 RepID=A0AAN6S7E7_9PEZI|nr:hypothetical protein QBC46DRAFT_447767 [Diplogelasinospora grovesii]